jgi:hypothetical protein
MVSMCDIPLRTMQNNTLSRASDGSPDGGIGPAGDRMNVTVRGFKAGD